MATTLAWTIMDGSAHADEGTAHEYTADTDETDPGGPVLFDAIVVRYRSDNDRCTLVPREGSTEKKLNAWLTADLEAVIDLDDAR